MTATAACRPRPRTIIATAFMLHTPNLKADEAATAEEMRITKNGRPVSRLTPYRERPTSWFGRDRDIIQIHGNITEPIDVEWEAQSDPDRVLNP